MLTIKYLLLGVAAVMFTVAAAKIIHDLYRKTRRDEFGDEDEAADAPFPIGWRVAGLLAAAAWVPLLAGLSIVVVPSGSAGIRISQISGTRPGTLYPGTHWIVPLIESVAVYDVRDHLFTTSAAEPATDDRKPAAETLRVQTSEGLLVGIAVAVRYRLDPARLDFIHDNLPQPPGAALVPPVVVSVFRQQAPNFRVRELFATRREEIRRRSAKAITQKLAADAIVVKEVMLRNILLPESYADGLEGLLLEQQENERMAVEIEVKRKLVRAAELEAKAVEYSLELEAWQLEQELLETEARIEARLAEAEAAADAELITGEAERERRLMMVDAEIRETRLASASEWRLTEEFPSLPLSPMTQPCTNTN